MPYKCLIGGADYSQYFKEVEAEPGGDGVVGTAILILDKLAGGLSIVDMMPVQVWQTFNDAGAGVAQKGRLLGGHIKTRTTGNMGTTKLWSLDCWDYNVILHLTVRDGQPVKQISLSAGTFAAQVASVTDIIQRNGIGAPTIGIDASSGVANLFASMPAAIYEGGHEYGWYIQQLCLTVQGLASTGGAITGRTVTAGGTGYTSAPTVTVAPPPAGGTQATMTATVSGGVVTALTVTNVGRGYPTPPAISFSGPGTGATATCTVSALVFSVLPAYYMGLANTFGVSDTFGNPTLYIYDASILPSPSLSFSDVVAGGRKGIYDRWQRVTDASAPIVQRQQSLWGVQYFTSSDTTSQAQYPNPYINHGTGSGFWQQPLIKDTSSASAAEAQAALDRFIRVKAYPRDTYTFETEERVLPGETIGVGNALEGIPDDTIMRVASVRMRLQPPDKVVSTLTINTRRLSLLDDGTEGVYAPPIEGDSIPPMPPADFTLTSNVFNRITGSADLTFAITVSPSPDVAGYQISGRVNNLPYFQDVGVSLTPTISLLSGVPYSLQAEAYDSHRNFSDGVPVPPLVGTTAIATPDPPTLLLVDTAWTWGINGYLYDNFGHAQVSLIFTPPAILPEHYILQGWLGSDLAFETRWPGAYPHVITPNVNVGDTYTFMVYSEVHDLRSTTAASLGPLRIPSLGVPDIINPGFEAVNAGVLGGIRGWTKTQTTGGTVAQDTDEHTGTYSAKMVTSGTIGTVASLETTDLVAVRGAVEVLKYWAKRGASGTLKYTVQCYDASGASLGSAITGTRTLTAAWTDKPYTEVVPLVAGAAYKKIKFEPNALSQTVYVDDVSMVPQVGATDYGADSVPQTALQVITDTSLIVLNIDPANPLQFTDNAAAQVAQMYYSSGGATIVWLPDGTRAKGFQLRGNSSFVDLNNGTVELQAAAIALTGTATATDPAFLGQRGITSSVQATTVAETILASFTQPANSLVVGRVYSLLLRGRVGSELATRTVTLRLRLNGTGGTQVISLSFAIPAGSSNLQWQSQIDFTCRSLGSSGTIWGSGNGILGAVASIVTGQNTALTLNTTASNTLDITAAWSAANVANIWTIDQAWLEQSR